jgi:hypothetical protein
MSVTFDLDEEDTPPPGKAVEKKVSKDADGHETEEVSVSTVNTGFSTKKTPDAQVSFGLGFTQPTQPYANVRASVSITVASDMKNIAAAYQFAKDWVDERTTAVRTAIIEAVADNG